MQKIIFYTIIIFISLVSKTFAQEKTKKSEKQNTFEKQIEEISTAMEFIVFREKNELKLKIDSLETLHSNNKISNEELKSLKLKEAELSATRIENGINAQRTKLDQLIQSKVDDSSEEISYKIDTINGKKIITYYKDDGRVTINIGTKSKDSIGKNTTEINIGSMKIYKGEKDKIEKKQKRTTSQFVFAAGLNNVITENEDLEHSDFRVWGSHFYEWGMTYNTRIFKNDNLLHAKYGFSVMYNNLRPTDNRYFEKNGDQTNLQVFPEHLKESRLRNVYLVFPAHLEFDFTPKKVSKDGESTIFKTHESVRIGFGGYAGVRVKSKQILKYELEGDRIKDKQKGDFNASDFSYGLSTYIGYKQTSLYLKYDLNPVFKDNAVDQNNVSLGIRFDFN